MKFTYKILVLAALGAGLFLMSGCGCCGRTAALPDNVNPEIESPAAG